MNVPSIKHGRTATTRQRGIALITAVFVVALASIAATALLSIASVAIRRTANLQDSETAWWYADGLETWVAGLLRRRSGAADVDGLGDPWAQPVTDMPFGRGSVRGQMIDLQGRFNLNNLAVQGDVTAYREQFARLLAALPGIDATGYSGLGTAIAEWTQPPLGQTAGTTTSDATYYLSLDVPYRPSQQLMTSPSELLAIRGMTPALYRALLPYVAALPRSGTKININTAPLPVLLSLASDVDAGKLQDFTKTRVKAPLQKVEDAYQTKDNLLPADVTAARISVSTDFFQLQARISVGAVRLHLFSDIERSGSGVPFVYRRATGTP